MKTNCKEFLQIGKTGVLILDPFLSNIIKNMWYLQTKKMQNLPLTERETQFYNQNSGTMVRYYATMTLYWVENEIKTEVEHVTVYKPDEKGELRISGIQITRS